MEQHYKTHNYLRIKEYRKWCKSPIKKMIYEFLFFAIIRESEEVKNWRHPGHYVYKKYYKQGLLVARYSQEKIAEYLNINEKYVSRCLIDMHEKGFIRIIKENRPTTTVEGEPITTNINYYVFGEHNNKKIGTSEYEETYYLDQYFNKLRKIQEAEKEIKTENIRKEAKEWLDSRMESWDNIVDDEIKRIKNGFSRR